MKVEIRNDSVLIEGYVNVAGRDSKPIPSRKGKFIEQIVPGTFTKALERAENVDVLLNHDHNKKLTDTSQGFQLYEDAIGLYASGEISDPGLVERARNNRLRGWSFGFIPLQERYEEKEGSMDKRYIEDMDLLEVSIIDDTKSPCYIATSIIARDEGEEITELRGMDDHIEVIDNSKKVIDYTDYENRISQLKSVK